MIDGTSYFGEAVFLPQLAVTRQELEGYRFTECLLVGPAVVALTGAGSFVDNSMEGRWDALMWELAPERTEVIGAIGLKDCHVERCRLERIGICGPPDLITRLASVTRVTGPER